VAEPAAVVLLIRARRDLRRVERIARTFTEKLGPAPPLAELGLTPRELEVLELMGRGSERDADIAAALQISPLTARTHVRNIMARAGVTSRRDLVALYLDLNGR
jgi:DNA-binding CsgD family transcriptional regulator